MTQSALAIKCPSQQYHGVLLISSDMKENIETGASGCPRANKVECSLHLIKLALTYMALKETQ